MRKIDNKKFGVDSNSSVEDDNNKIKELDYLKNCKNSN